MNGYISREFALSCVDSFLSKTDMPIAAQYFYDCFRECEAADVQPVNQWVSTKDRLPEESDEYLAVVDGVIMEVSYDPKQEGLICVWSTCDADGFRPLPDDAVTHWMPFPELPQD